MSKYTAGVTYTDWTTLGIFVDDNAGAIDFEWELTFRATTPDINGDAGNILPLSTLELTTTDAAASLTAKGAFFTVGATALTAVDQVMVCRGTPGCGNAVDVAAAVDEPNWPTDDDRVAITYDCGTTTPLLGSAADFYTVDIEFTLSACFDPAVFCP